MKWLKYTLLFLMVAGTMSFLLARSYPLQKPAAHYESLGTSSDSSELLAFHATVARYNGTVDKGCRFLTAQCPDHCNHAKRWAEFSIISYTEFHSHSQYGTMQEQIAFALEGSNAVTDSSIRQSLTELSVGDTVRLTWEHLYVTKEGASYPQREITSLESLN